MGDFGAEISIQKLEGGNFSQKEIIHFETITEQLKEKYSDLKDAYGEFYLFSLITSKEIESSEISTLTYILSNHHGDKRDCEFCYDVELKDARSILSHIKNLIAGSDFKLESYYQFLGSRFEKAPTKVDVEKIRMRLHIMEMNNIQTRILLKNQDDPIIGIVKELKYDVNKNDNLLNLELEDGSEFSIYTKKILKVDRADKY